MRWGERIGYIAGNGELFSESMSVKIF